MHVRIVRLTGSPAKLSEGVEHFKDKIAPALKQIHGHKGATLAVDRATGKGLVASYWHDEATMRASEEAAKPLREQGSSAFGGSPGVPEHYEVALQHRSHPPKADTWARVTTIRGDRAKVDEGIGIFEKQVIPALKQLPGFRGALLFVDRTTGNSVVATVWDTKAALDDSHASVLPLREQAAKAMGATGSESVQVETFEIVHSDAPAAIAV